MNKFETFRLEAPEFVYRNFTVEETESTVEISYLFDITGLAEFHPSWSFPKPAETSVKNDLTFERLAFSLGMAEAVSYWKAVCSPLMRVECGELSEEQVKWWKKLYFSGLGEFFYINGIQTDIESFVNIKASGRFASSDEAVHKEPKGCLVPVSYTHLTLPTN